MLRHIKYFQAVVRRGSFTQAAEECFISQSAVSQQIQTLEEALGVKLLNRDKRRFSLTPAGKYFYEKSLILTADFEKICRETVKIANKDNAILRIGYLNCYGGHEFQYAVAQFTQRHPDVSIDIVNGSHEDLYDLLRSGGVDIILNDQRRAFSDEYVNCILTTANTYIEVAQHSPIAKLKSIEVSDLKDTPCILVASATQQENEQAYYRDIVGFGGEFLFADNLETARMMTAGGKGIMPIEGSSNPIQFGTALHRVMLTRNTKPILRSYCAFWRADNSGYYVEEFADILKAQFENN